MGCSIVGLVVIDVAVGLAFRLPADARSEGSSLQNYFNYGRSIEGKLRYLVGRTPEEDAPIIKAGWLLQDCYVERNFPAGKLSSIAVPTLKANDIEFVATSTIVSPDDSGNFVADGHFTPAAFEKIAGTVLKLLGNDVLRNPSMPLPVSEQAARNDRRMH
jgi:hypothetical protein